jgi:putative peptidoglycan lipid II flippase
LQACEKHINTLLECVPASILLIWILLAANGTSAPLIWGTTLGFSLQAWFLGVLARRADGIRPNIRFSFRSSQWPAMYQAVGVFVVGQLVMSMVTPLDQYFVVRLGTGAIATLGYANRLLSLVLSMGALAIGRATLPVFSDILSGDTPERAHTTAFKWAFAMFMVGLGVMVVGWFGATAGVRMMFERGAFTAEDTFAVASLLRWGLFQLPFYFAVLVIVQLFAGEGRFREMAVIAVANFIIKAIADYFLVKAIGISGILLATALMYACSFAGYIALSKRKDLKKR